MAVLFSGSEGAYAALLDCAWAISPRCPGWGQNARRRIFGDTVILDLAGCEKLLGSPEKIAHGLKRIASEVGLEDNVAVAGSPLAAVCAAQGFPGVTVILDGDERLQMGRLSLEGSAHSVRVRRNVEALGRPYMQKNLRLLPEIAIVERLGQEGSAGCGWRGSELSSLDRQRFSIEF